MNNIENLIVLLLTGLLLTMFAIVSLPVTRTQEEASLPGDQSKAGPRPKPETA